MAPRGLAGSGVGLLAGAVLLLGSSWPVTKYALDGGAAPLWFATWRLGLSGCASTIGLAAGRRLRWPGRADLPAIIAVGLLQLAGFFAFATAAAAWVTAGRTAMLANTTTIWLIPLSVLVLKERITPQRWVGALFGIAGVAVLVGPWAIDWSDPHVLIGHALLLAAGLSWSIAIIVVRRRPMQMTMLEMLPWSFGLATLALLPVAMWFSPGGGIGVRPTGWVALGYIGVVVGPIGTWCVSQATVILPTLVSSVGFLVIPAFGVVVSTLWLGEPLGPSLLAGSALILGGVLVVAWPRRRVAR